MMPRGKCLLKVIRKRWVLRINRAVFKKDEMTRLIKGAMKGGLLMMIRV